MTVLFIVDDTAVVWPLLPILVTVDVPLAKGGILAHHHPVLAVFPRDPVIWRWSHVHLPASLPPSISWRKTLWKNPGSWMCITLSSGLSSTYIHVYIYIQLYIYILHII